MDAVVNAWSARARHGRRLISRVEPSAAWIAALALYASILLFGAARLLAPDSWLAFVAGREIARSGLPATDTLTVWAGGTQWIDQQWLGHLLIYLPFATAGLRAALLLNVVVLVATLALAGFAARSRGASSGTVAIVLLGVMLAIAAATALRTETLAYALFVAVVWLLTSEARVPSRRVLLVLPLLVLWTNVHGSALLGAGLCALHGLLTLADRRRGLVAVPLLLSPLCVLASPYGLATLDYFGRTIGNSSFPHLLEEWQPTTFPDNWRFFALATVAAWFVARADDLTPFERVSFVALAAVGLLARRYTVWLPLYLAVVLPSVIDARWRHGQLVRRRTTAVLALAGVFVVAVGVTVLAVRPTGGLRSAYPVGVERVVETELARDPTLRIFASELYADWLLYSVGSSRGRVAFDTRFELLTDRQLESLIRFTRRADGWRNTIAGYELLVLETERRSDIVAALAGERGTRRLYADSRVTVLRRSSPR